MRTVTTIKNPTKERQHYSWAPKHGATLEPGESLEINGIIKTPRRRMRLAMTEDLNASRVIVVTGFNVEETPASQPEKVVSADKPVEKKDTKVEHKNDLVTEITLPENDESDELNMPGVELVDEDEEEETYYDERGKEIEKEESPVILNNMQDFDPDDVLAKKASEKPVKEAPVEEPAEEQSVEIPSKTALRKKKVADVRSLADSMGIEYEDDASKKSIIELIDNKR